MTNKGKLQLQKTVELKGKVMKIFDSPLNIEFSEKYMLLQLEENDQKLTLHRFDLEQFKVEQMDFDQELDTDNKMFKLNDGKLLYSFKNGNKKIQAILEKDYQEANKLNAIK